MANNKICHADLHASSLFFFPRKCPETTAPPVARAENTLISKMLTVSTSETPETAASPAAETIIVSAIPTAIARICSMISGIISFRRSFPE